MTLAAANRVTCRCSALCKTDYRQVWTRNHRSITPARQTRRCRCPRRASAASRRACAWRRPLALPRQQAGAAGPGAPAQAAHAAAARSRQRHCCPPGCALRRSACWQPLAGSPCAPLHAGLQNAPGAAWATCRFQPPHQASGQTPAWLQIAQSLHAPAQAEMREPAAAAQPQGSHGPPQPSDHSACP